MERFVAGRLGPNSEWPGLQDVFGEGVVVEVRELPALSEDSTHSVWAVTARLPDEYDQELYVTVITGSEGARIEQIRAFDVRRVVMGLYAPMCLAAAYHSAPATPERDRALQTSAEEWASMFEEDVRDERRTEVLEFATNPPDDFEVVEARLLCATDAELRAFVRERTRAFDALAEAVRASDTARRNVLLEEVHGSRATRYSDDSEVVFITLTGTINTDIGAVYAPTPEAFRDMGRFNPFYLEEVESGWYVFREGS